MGGGRSAPGTRPGSCKLTSGDEVTAVKLSKLAAACVATLAIVAGQVGRPPQERQSYHAVPRKAGRLAREDWRNRTG